MPKALGSAPNRKKKERKKGRHCENEDNYKPSRVASRKASPAGTMILDVQAPGTVRNEFLLEPPRLWRFLPPVSADGSSASRHRVRAFIRGAMLHVKGPTAWLRLCRSISNSPGSAGLYPKWIEQESSTDWALA